MINSEFPTYLLVNEPQHNAQKTSYFKKHNGETQNTIILKEYDGSTTDPTSVDHLYSLSYKDFREEILRKLKELNKTMGQIEQTTIKN